MLVLKPVEFSDLQEGDVVTYIINGGTMVTHRVVSIDRTAGTVTTKGDANNSEDAPVKKENIVGKVIFFRTACRSGI